MDVPRRFLQDFFSPVQKFHPISTDDQPCPTKQDAGRLQALLDKAKGKEGIKVVRKKLTKAIKALVSGRAFVFFGSAWQR